MNNYDVPIVSERNVRDRERQIQTVMCFRWSEYIRRYV